MQGRIDSLLAGRREKAIAERLLPELTENLERRVGNPNFDLFGETNKSYKSASSFFRRPGWEFMINYVATVHSFDKQDIGYEEVINALSLYKGHVSAENEIHLEKMIGAYHTDTPTLDEANHLIVDQLRPLRELELKTAADISLLEMWLLVNDRFTSNFTDDYYLIREKVMAKLGEYNNLRVVDESKQGPIGTPPVHEPGMMRYAGIPIVTLFLLMAYFGSRDYQGRNLNAEADSTFAKPDTFQILNWEHEPAPKPYDRTGVFPDSEYLVMDLLRDSGAKSEFEFANIMTKTSLESGFRPDVKSEHDALGLLQVLPSTAALHGYTDEAEILKPENNIPLGKKEYDKVHNIVKWKRFADGRRPTEQESHKLALFSYVHGIGRVLDNIDRYQLNSPDELVAFYQWSLDNDSTLYWNNYGVDEPIPKQDVAQLISHDRKYKAAFPIYQKKVREFLKIAENNPYVWGRSKPVLVTPPSLTQYTTTVADGSNSINKDYRYALMDSSFGINRDSTAQNQPKTP